MTTSLRLIIILFIYTILNSCTNKTENVNSENEEDSQIGLTTSVPSKLSYDELYDKTLTLWDVPFEQKDLTTPFGNAHIIISGPKDAPPLILLHGMNASSTMWYPNISALSEDYRTYAIDFLLEPNKSDPKGDINKVEQVIDWYYDVINQLELDKFSIIGASKGGWLGLQMALRHQDRIERLILLSPAQTFTWILPEEGVFKNLAFAIDPDKDELHEALQAMSNDVNGIHQFFKDQYLSATKKSGLDEFMIKMTPISSDDLSSLEIPVMVLIGDNDVINRPKGLEEAKKFIPNSDTATIYNAGHFLSMDQAEKVNQYMLDFLESE